ncbi:MAG: LPS export ABC transporter periplasmic protein LptC [Leptospira sp.]|nr:LPS export ABC transporter periplasmic protein LptC [Leptospira sp.]
MKAIIASAYLFILFFNQSCTQKKSMKIENERESGSTISIRNFRRNAFDDKGTLLWKLKSEESFVYLLENKTIFYNILFDQYENGRLKTSVTGDRGEVNHTTKKLTLKGNIVLKSENSKTLSTDELLYDLDGKKLTTDSSVIVSGNGTVIRGIGLRADKDLNKVIILKPTAVTRGGGNPFKKD